MSLQQMALKDNADLRQTFMYQLSTKPCKFCFSLVYEHVIMVTVSLGFQYFKYVLLVGSHDDFYVPMHSALVQFCRPAMKDNTTLGMPIFLSSLVYIISLGVSCRASLHGDHPQYYVAITERGSHNSHSLLGVPRSTSFVDDESFVGSSCAYRRFGQRSVH